MVFILTLPFYSVFSQQAFEFTDSLVLERLIEDVYTLAAEEMEGREAGTSGERKAAFFIKERMKEIDLQPVFEESYLQEFEFFSGYVYNEDSYLMIGNQQFIVGEDFFIMPYSADADVTAYGVYAGSGLHIPELINDYEDLDDVEGKIFFIEYYDHPETDDDRKIDIKTLVEIKIASAIEHGAAGIIFVNSHGVYEDPIISRQANVVREDIPILFAVSDVYELFEQQEMYNEIEISSELIRKSYTAINVAGYLDNNAEQTVVIGGHYDHLGYGGRTSRDMQESVIHYGADDNASGTAGVLEAARYYTAHSTGHYNYLFIAFSAEEKGLLGSRYFADSEVYDLDKINFMFNLDMIGRMQDNRLIMIGTGTSPSWDEIIDKNQPEYFEIRKGRSGIGGSDHSSFYRKDIPVLFFHTGSHEDYHASTDTPEKIDYEAMLDIIKFAYDMIAFTKEMDKLEFSETPVTETRRRRSDAVTLGIMPDHAFEGTGLRIMAIIDERPAQKAGLQAGDIILGIEDVEVKEIYSYMRVLENLEKGTTISVLIQREEEKIILDVEL